MTMSPQLTRVASLADLKADGRLVVKPNGRQIVLFEGADGIHACNNRCPHEGYPLSEGDIDGCVLTCNWHNWKFDLSSGETLVGGDTLRRYPVEVAGDDVLLDLADPPPAEIRAAALDNLLDSFRRHEYDRMAREIARLQKAGGDPLDAVRAAIGWTCERMEFGMTHALGCAPDWLALRDSLAKSEAARLVAVTEIVGHLAWDTLREPVYPFPTDKAAFDAEALIAAIEAEDETRAAAIVLGGIESGLGFEVFEEPLTRAALAHYQGFGHALIYVRKAGQLIAALGPEAFEPVILALVRYLVYTTREDLIPEFRGYGKALSHWDGCGTDAVTAADFAGLNVNRALKRVLESSADIGRLFDALLGRLAGDMLRMDLDVPARTDRSVSHNVGWLDFTHGLTFTNAVRVQCSKYPDLWPQGLLQMACFAGRNTSYVERDLDVSVWQVAKPKAFLKARMEALFDHAEPEYIVSAHLVKVLSAVSEEIAHAPKAPWAGELAAAVNRFLESPLKRKHALRTARQSLAFVARED